MPAPSPRSFWLDLACRGARFLYLLWGGMLLVNLTLHQRLLFPTIVYHAPPVVRFFTHAWGRGLLLGLGLAMALAALFEMWELVDRLLARLLSGRSRES